MNRLIIIGAGGHGKVIADVAIKCGYRNIKFLDDNIVGNCFGFPIIGKIKDLENYNDGSTNFIIAIGNNKIRKIIAQKYKIDWCNLVHPTAVISTNVQLGVGTVIMANAVVNADAKIGNHCIINSSAVVEHDNTIGDFVHISPNVSIAGNVKIGELTHIGIGATLKNNIIIEKNIIIGAGAVVTKNILSEGRYVGIPAKKL